MRRLRKRFKNPDQFVPLPFGTIRKEIQNGGIRGILVREAHLPFALNSLLTRSKSAELAFSPASIEAIRAFNSARYAGSSAWFKWAIHAATSSRSTTLSAPMESLISARLISKRYTGV